MQQRARQSIHEQAKERKGMNLWPRESACVRGSERGSESTRREAPAQGGAVRHEALDAHAARRTYKVSGRGSKQRV